MAPPRDMSKLVCRKAERDMHESDSDIFSIILAVLAAVLVMVFMVIPMVVWITTGQ